MNQRPRARTRSSWVIVPRVNERAFAGYAGWAGVAMAALLATAACKLDVSEVPSFADAGACRDECEAEQAMCTAESDERVCVIARSGCRVWRTRPCMDTNACTRDVCDGASGRCTHVPDDARCGADKACAFGYCDAIAGCRTMPLPGPCDDGNACTADDRCVDGDCIGMQPAARLECVDSCPIDPDKTAPGACGCNQREVLDDRDGDGVLDCVDACPDVTCERPLTCADGKLASCLTDPRGCPQIEQPCDSRFSCVAEAPCPSIEFTEIEDSGLLASGTVAVASNGDVFTGWTTYANAAELDDLAAGDALITRFDPGGTRRNSFLYDSGTRDRFAALAVSPDDSTLAGAMHVGDAPMVVAWPATGGVERWAASIPLSGSASLVDVAYGPGGDVYAIGNVLGTIGGEASLGERDVFVVRLAAESGALLWARQFGSAGADEAVALVTDAGGVYVAGVLAAASQPVAGPGLGFVRKYDAGGELRWQREPELGADRAQRVHSLSLGTSGEIIVSATAGGPVETRWVFQLSANDGQQQRQAMIAADALLGDHELDFYGLSASAGQVVSLNGRGELRWKLDAALSPASVLLDATIWRPAGRSLRVFVVGGTPITHESGYLATVTVP